VEKQKRIKKMRKFEIGMTILYGVNVCLSAVLGNWTAALGWACALLLQLRIMNVINVD
jgi:hypothetical protein